MYRLLGIDRVVYFYDIFYKGNYSYNGGTYVVAPFYGNFGPIGMLIPGLFIALYINIVVMFLSSNHSVVRLAGFFMIAILFRAFWYELISVIKPVVVVFIPLYMMTYLLNGASLKQTNGGGVAA